MSVRVNLNELEFGYMADDEDWEPIVWASISISKKQQKVFFFDDHDCFKVVDFDDPGLTIDLP